MPQTGHSAVLFLAADRQYCISSAEVVRIRYLGKDDVSPLPMGRRGVLGLINLDGRPVLLTDPFGCKEMRACMVVKGVSGEFAFLTDRVLRTVQGPETEAVQITAEEILGLLQ